MFGEFLYFISYYIGNALSPYIIDLDEKIFRVVPDGIYVDYGFVYAIIYIFIIISVFKLFWWFIKKLLSLLSAKIKRELNKKK